MPTFKLLACDINQKGLARSVDGGMAIFPTGGATNATVQASSSAGSTWGSAVVKVYRSNSMCGPYVDFATPVQLTAAGMTAELDTSGAAFVALSISTAEGSTQYGDFAAFFNERNS